MKYQASTDRTVKIITAGVFVLFLFISITNISILMKEPDNNRILLSMSASIIFSIVLLLFCYLYAPQSYEVTDTELIIQRKLKDVIIPISDIKEVKLVDDQEMKGLIRTFGVGGLFGYYGKFYSTSFGSMTFYATQSRNRMLIVRGDDKKLVLTPDDVSMLHELQSKIG